VAAALRHWDKFSKVVLRQAAHRTLPPMNADDVRLWAATFANEDTALNYFSAVKWACELCKMDLSWVESTKDLRNGIAKKRFQLLGSVVDEIADLLENLWVELVLLAKHLKLVKIHCALVLWYAFLMRVQSEGIGLQKGAPQEMKALPAGRHSAVVVERGSAEHLDRLGIHWAKRKARPMGAIQWRSCACARLPRCACPVHGVMDYVEKFGVGEKILVDLKAGDALRQLQRLARLAGSRVADELRMKYFRRGAATSLAKRGVHVVDILHLGDWRSKAVTNYVNPAELDPEVVMAHALREDDSDDDEE
jgi:hypothetical protein